MWAYRAKLALLPKNYYFGHKQLYIVLFYVTKTKRKNKKQKQKPLKTQSENKNCTQS